MSNYKKTLKNNLSTLLKKILDKLNQSEKTSEDLHVLIENTEECFLIVNTNLEIINFNNKFQQDYAYFLGKVIEKGKNVLSYAQPSKVESVREIYQKVFKGEVIEAEIQVSVENGVWFTFLNRYKPIYNKQKKIIGAFVSSFDITAIKKAQSELQQSEEKYRSIVESSLNAFFFTLPDGTILNVNQTAIDLFGYTVEEFRVIGLQGVIDHTNVNFIKLLTEREELGKVKGELTGIRKNGEQFPCEFSSTYYKANNGEIRTCTFLNDISARKKVEKEASLQEKRFRTLVENVGDIITLSDKDGIIYYVSPAFERLTGFSATEIIHKPNYLCMHPDHAEQTKEILQKLLLTPGFSISCVNRLACKDGNYIWIEGSETNLLNDENVQAIVSNYHDITARTIAEEKIKQSETSLKTIFENTSEAFILVDSSWMVKAFNSKAKAFAFLNTDNEMEVEREIMDFISESRKEVIFALFSRAFTGETIQFDRLYTNKEGKAIWIDFLIIPVIEDQKIQGICVTGRDITARKVAEEALRKSELRFRSLIEYSHDILFLFDSKGKIEFLSPAIEKIFGYKNEENQIRNINIFDGIHPDDIETLIERLKLAFETPGIPIPIVVRNRKNDGTYLWLEGTITDMLHIAEVNVIVGNFRDITERKIFEDQQALFVSIVNSSDDAIFSKSLDYIITSWNRGAEKIFGYKEGEVIGKNSSVITPPERFNEEKEILEKIKKGESIEHFETQRMKKNGELIYISLTVSPITDSKGKITGASKIARDISDKKASEDKIKNREKRFRILQQNSTDGLSLMAIDGIMLEISPAGKKIIGYEEEELIGKARYDLIHPEDLSTVSEGFIEVINDVNKINYFEYRSLMRDGSYKWLEASCQNLLNEPAVEAIVVNYRDITERKNQEIEREQLINTMHQNNNDLRHFSYITSHNLKAPLSNLMGFIKLIDDFPVENPILSNIIEGFKTSTILLNDTVNDLVKILIIRDNNSIELKETSFKKIFDQICIQLQNLIHEVEPAINTDFELMPNVVFNETYLGSIFLNLLTNAIKYRSYERKLKIDIVTKLVNNEIILTFSDNGIGIDIARHRAKIFGLYQRFHNRPNSKGMGLYLIKSQMDSLEGSIEVDSKIDIGTTFTLKFKKI